MNKVLIEDIESFSQNFPIVEDLKGKSFLVTGATGLIGSILVKCLCSLNLRYRAGIKVIALGRNQERASELFHGDDVKFICTDICAPLNIAEQIDYIVHCASPTSSVFLSESPVETMQSIFEGTDRILCLGREKRVAGMVYLSSLEMYGVNGDDHEIKEDELGYLDVTKARSSYPVAKLGAECLCSAYWHEYGLPVKVARLTQILGAGVSADDKRVFAQFARSVTDGKDIVLHTTGESSKPYCYTTDAVEAILFIMLKGESGEVYNVATPDTYISIRSLAELLVREFAPASEVKLEIEGDHGYAPATRLRLNTDKVMALGWKPRHDLKEMFGRLIESIKR